MGISSGRVRRVVVAGALLPLALVAGLAGEAASLPPQASPVGVEHAHTHGPDAIALDPRGPAPADAPYDVDELAAWAEEKYDGLAPTTDQPDLTTLPTIHAIYVYPADRSSRFARFAPMFQADARDASALLAEQYQRGIRFDERRGDDGSNYLDITVVKSRYRYQKLSSASQFNLVANELAARGFTSANKKYAVWLDAGSQYCGQGHLYQDTRRSALNYNEGRTTAIVYRPYDPGDSSGGFCRGRTLRHEIGHNLGALQKIAPHAFDGAHCDDSAEDTMCYRTANAIDTGNAAFDHNQDDYWDPVAGTGRSTTLGWWTVNLSRFVCPPGGDCTKPNIPEF